MCTLGVMGARKGNSEFLSDKLESKGISAPVSGSWSASPQPLFPCPSPPPPSPQPHLQTKNVVF